MKRGQAALEFMMTYGWAILIILAALGALSYIGIFDLGNILPERCSFPVGFDCAGDAVIDATNNHVLFLVQNTNPFPINITTATVDSEQCENPLFQSCPGSSCTNFSQNTYVAANDEVTMRIQCDNIFEGNFNVDVTVKYFDTEAQIMLSSPGTIRGQAAD